MIDVHIGSVVRLCYEIIPFMTEGYIINTSSLAAYLPTSYNHIYASTKTFLITFTLIFVFLNENFNASLKVIKKVFVLA